MRVSRVRCLELLHSHAVERREALPLFRVGSSKASLDRPVHAGREADGISCRHVDEGPCIPPRMIRIA